MVEFANSRCTCKAGGSMLTFLLLIMALPIVYKRYHAIASPTALYFPAETAFPGNDYNLLLDKLNAINGQIDACHAVIKALDREAQATDNPLQLSHIRKKQADLVYRISTLSEKADKLDRQLNGETV